MPPQLLIEYNVAGIAGHHIFLFYVANFANRVGIVQHGPGSTLGPAYSIVDPRVSFLPCILLELSIRAGPGVGPRFYTFIGDRAKGVGSIMALTVKYCL